MRNARVFVNHLRVKAPLCYASMMLDVAERAGQMPGLGALRDAPNARLPVTLPSGKKRRKQQ